MTKKDFILIAAALKATQPSYAARAQVAHDITINAIADALATTNPLFDRARFLAACGVPS